MKRTHSAVQESGPATERHEGFTAEEREAMKERAKELKTARRGSKTDPEGEVLAKISEMPEADRVLAEKVHEIIKAGAPQLTSRLWYGMPAYAKNGKIFCFFQSAQKFKSKYATLGFSDQAALDDGAMWPASYALTRLTAAEEKRVGALVKQAAG
ncbi:iron chaperone [Streptomyces sp. NPDC058424]|uniref:iron chaperone n=1 Tax=Streptomyces sp. NPDC058424 TaxID=3346491 RepID=UPI003655DEB1